VLRELFGHWVAKHFFFHVSFRQRSGTRTAHNTWRVR